MEKNNRDIAIIGISTRFPGANSLNEFWQNLLDGKESITFPKENGNSKAPFPHACIDGIELFDADFFNFSSKEAIYTDPQFRLLLESAWQALEDSGYNPETFKEEIGVYAGSYYSSYLFNNVLKSKKNKEDFLDQFDEIHRCVNDFLASSIAYKLNLTGPSLTVQSWCVSALSSIHVAVQALRNNECSMALAGGVTLHVPQESYKYQTITGFISKDGHCRSFDKDGHGATVGNGLGMVVLKRLDEAIENRDNIYAIIKGTGLTNDGKPISKLSYTGVTMGGQLRAINKAIADAGVKPNSVSYIEANGNATEISDRLELRAFALAYAEKDTKGEDLLIGAVKPNIGHLNSVAGLPGFVKAVLSLKNKEIPPTINFNSFNKKSIRNKTFIKVNDKLTKLNGNINKHKFGVHSFGIGGSNIHMILEEAPEIVSNKETREHNIITLSAKTSTSLKNKLIQYESFISSSSVHISDIAYTNNIGRKEFEYRYAFSFKNKEALLSSIKNEIENDSVKLGSINTSKKLAFTFPGYGDGVLNSAKDLYENEPVFNKYFKECSELLLSKYHINIEDILIKDDVINKKTSNDYFITFLSIFIIEYSMGKTLIEWGLKPDVLLGYSCGEFAAACISGIISIEEALFIINEFNTKINSTDKGRMLAIWIPKRDLDGLIDNTISIAGINGSDTFVLSGPVNSIKQLENTLILKNIDFLDIESDYAFHSYMMKPHADRITEKIGNFEFRSPKIDCYSLSTRNKLTSESYNQYSYWNDLLCKPVDFENSIKPILNDPNYVIVEVGTSNTLTQLVKNHPEYNSEQLAISCAGEISFTENLAQKSLMNTICKIWEQGITIDWESFYSCEERSRVSIPTYCFERKRYWVDEDKIDNGNEKREEDDTQKLIQEKEVLENNDVEKVIRDTWCKLFGKNDISINDDFVKLGGHSLIATMFINKMQVIYPSIDISFKDFFNNPTINQLSEYVRDELRTGPKKDISDLKIVIEFKEASPNERLLLMTEYFLSIICRIKGIKRGEITNEIDIKEFNLEDISGQIYTIFKRELSLPLYQFELLNKTSAKELLEFLTKEYEIRLGLVE
ncbi:MAG: acyltransferase domain-containing protein, partial [bacterium]|nr:acyltransferase domain-containing protein [bacterium]